MTLSTLSDELTDGEWARHPQSLAIEADFDGWSQASGGPARYFPRILTADEHECWRDGWLEAKAERAEFGNALTVRQPITVLSWTARPECAMCPLVGAA